MGNDYRIDTGDIFTSLLAEWQKFDRNFLKAHVQEALENALISKNIVSTSGDATNAVYFENQVMVRYPTDLEMCKNSSRFPFPDYFLVPQKNSPYQNIINYVEPCVLTIDDDNYDLFFALKLSLTDIMEETEDFLKFHLKKTFENDIFKFKSYLVNLCLKYSDFLHDKYEPLINRFIESYIVDEKITEEIKEDFISDGNKEFTIARQVIAIEYLLNAQGVNRNVVDLTQIAKFIQFLTGRETGVEKINNTNIYKKVKGSQPKSGKLAKQDLQFVKQFFVNLQLQSIVDIIDTDISKLRTN